MDVPEVREAIKPIMEGGEAGFNLRREKYGLERLTSLMARVVRGRYLVGAAAVTGEGPSGLGRSRKMGNGV
jgi:hypothetical protein